MRQTTKTTMIALGASAAAAGIAVGSTIVAAHVLFRFALDTKKPWSIPNRQPESGSGYGDDQSPVRDADDIARSEAWFDEAKQPVTLRSRDGLLLHGWLLDPDCASPTPHMYAVCCHGYTGEPREMAKWAHHYAKLGFTVLVPALRAHELSEGRYIGMGWLEHFDLLDWIDLIVKADARARLLLHGNSMGAATVMMTAGDARLPRNVVAAVCDCGYSSTVRQFTDTAMTMFRLPRPLASLMVGLASRVCRRHAGYRFEDASCTGALRHATIPMLFVHGGADDFVSPASLNRNYAACASIHREKLLVPGAGHTMSASTAPDVYWRKVTGFVRGVFGL
ncbi:alpha/beta hydrolase [Bifidobacterium sp. 82T10]|uniref:Alpha/beta hydrolase n=1 Tax=Bifidobacterium miconis TaxID=2834435 RepID=A0ABS6WC95_9BIFI|nr:alpha/beta hydrolase [Bifidobacterium miconis]MBW3091467.1 alpha/beta hydrolase [Bifidobacterium miconis]